MYDLATVRLQLEVDLEEKQARCPIIAPSVPIKLMLDRRRGSHVERIAVKCVAVANLRNMMLLHVSAKVKRHVGIRAAGIKQHTIKSE